MENITEGLIPLATPIENITLLPGNPRKGDIVAVAKSYETFGQRKPIVVKKTGEDKDGNPIGIVIAGNHQLQAATKLGWKKIAAVFVEDDDITAKAYALADNRTAELGGYDNDLLAKLIEEVSVNENLLEATAWTADDLQEIQKKRGGLTDPDSVPSAPKKTISQLGDLWILGTHRLIVGDATNPQDFAKLTDGEKMDMVWTDPPYGVEVQGGTKEKLTIMNDGKDLNKLDLLLDKAFDNAINVCKKGATWYVAAPSGPNNLVFAKLLVEKGIWRQGIVWVKNTFNLGHSDYQYRHESIFYGWVPGDKRVAPPNVLVDNEDSDYEEGYEDIYFGWIPDAAHKRPPNRRQDTVWEIPKPKRNADHPTMKPINLILRSIWNSTKQNDKILDMFGGSGSTLIAAVQSKRKAYMMELDPKYADVICKRFQEHTGIIPVRNDIAVDFTEEI